MKTIKRLETIFLILVASLLSVSLIFSVFDHTSAQFLTVLLGFTGSFAVFGVAAILFVAIVLHHHKNKIVRNVADVVVAACMLPVLTAAIYGVAYIGSGAAIILSLVASILYVLASIVKLIGHIVIKAKPDINDELDPENDEKIVCIIKWKRLLEKGIITEEEFQAKRTAILEFGEKKEEIL